MEVGVGWGAGGVGWRVEGEEDRKSGGRREEKKRKKKREKKHTRIQHLLVL